MFKVYLTLHDGTKIVMAGTFDEEWAGRLVSELRRCGDVLTAEARPI